MMQIIGCIRGHTNRENLKLLPFYKILHLSKLKIGDKFSVIENSNDPFPHKDNF